MADETAVNSASAKQVRQRRKSSTLRARAAADRLRRLLAQDDFRVWGWDHLAACGVYTQADVESTNRVLVNEGRRAIGLKFLTECELAVPGALELMRVAHFNRKDPS